MEGGQVLSGFSQPVGAHDERLDDEAPVRGSGDEKLVQQQIPLKVKNTFIDFEDNSFAQDGSEGRASQPGHWKRQQSEPAPSAHSLPAGALHGWACPEEPPLQQPAGYGGLDFSAQPPLLQPPPPQAPAYQPRQQQQQQQQEQHGKGARLVPSGVAEPMHVQAAIPELAAAIAGLALGPGDEGAEDPTAALGDAAAPPAHWGDATTVMMRNLPNKYTQRMLLAEINNTGFLGTYDFLYLPIDPDTAANKGYAFLNFIGPGISWMFKVFYEGRKMKRFNSNKVVSVVPATLQGFEANYAHYSSARVNRGDPAARPIFLREPSQPLPAAGGGARGGKGGRRPRGGGGGGGGGKALLPAPGAPPQLMWQVAAAMASTARNLADPSGGGVPQHGLEGDMAPGAMVPKFCPHCGCAIQQFFQFCPQCGSPLDFGMA